jgi:hypothetical protein
MLFGSHRRSNSNRESAVAAAARVVPCVLTAVALMSGISSESLAQQGQSPVAPSSTIGPVTDSPTLSVLGLASLPTAADLTRRDDLWFGATQPLGALGRVRFSAIGNGNWRVRDAVGSNGAYEGTFALRARARVGSVRAWSAVSYGHVNIDGTPGGGLLPGRSSIPIGFEGAHADTTVSSRVDIGNIGRAEAGVLTLVSGVELSFGFSVERATRVTTQTLTIDVNDGMPPSSPIAAERVVTTRTVRGIQRRDIATGIAAMGFNTGSASWLVSVTSPVATWITSDALSPKPRISPTIASVAIVQPVSTWFSVVAAAATNSSSVGTTILRDDIEGRRSSIAPVLALGLRFSRKPAAGRGNDTPHGILSFETHTIGGVDSAAVTQADVPATEDSDTLRVLLLIDAPRAESVELMGDATAWVVTQMQRNKNGRWRAELKLTPGMHRITVRADGGRWVAPPGLPVGNDDYGSPVGMIVVTKKLGLEIGGWFLGEFGKEASAIASRWPQSLFPQHPTPKTQSPASPRSAYANHLRRAVRDSCTGYSQRELVVACSDRWKIQLDAPARESVGTAVVLVANGNRLNGLRNSKEVAETLSDARAKPQRANLNVERRTWRRLAVHLPVKPDRRTLLDLQ